MAPKRRKTGTRPRRTGGRKAPKVNKTLAKRSKRVPAAPPRGLQLARPGDDLPLYVTLDEIKRARAASNGQCRVLLGVLWSTGCRVSEALGVRVADLDAREMLVTLSTLKKRRVSRRVVPVPGAYMAEVLAWCHSNNLHGDVRVFQWHRTSAWSHVRAALVDAGVESNRASPKALRHGHAMHAVLNGVPLNVVQRNLGHATINTTALYLRATARDVQREYKGLEW